MQGADQTVGLPTYRHQRLTLAIGVRSSSLDVDVSALGDARRFLGSQPGLGPRGSGLRRRPWLSNCQRTPLPSSKSTCAQKKLSWFDGKARRVGPKPALEGEYDGGCGDREPSETAFNAPLLRSQSQR